MNGSNSTATDQLVQLFGTHTAYVAGQVTIIL